VAAADAELYQGLVSEQGGQVSACLTN